MSYNSGNARRIFYTKWNKLREEYRAAGMGEDAIQKLYEYDLAVFNNDRAHHRYDVEIPTANDSENQSDYVEYERATTVTDTYHETKTRFAWVGEIKNEKLHIRNGGAHLEPTWKFQRGDVYFVRLELGIGSEQNGVRPVVILQNDVGNACSPTLIVAALTSKIEKKAMQPTHSLVELDGLEPSIVQTEQIFTIDKSRVIKYLGHLTSEEMHRVDDAVRISLALNPMGSVQKLKPIIRSTAAYAPPETVDGQPPVYPYTPIKSNFEDAGTVQEMMMYTELQSAVQAMIQRLEYSFTFNPSLLTIPKRKQQVTEILAEAETYIWRIKEEMRCA